MWNMIVHGILRVAGALLVAAEFLLLPTTYIGQRRVLVEEVMREQQYSWN